MVYSTAEIIVFNKFSRILMYPFKCLRNNDGFYVLGINNVKSRMVFHAILIFSNFV